MTTYRLLVESPQYEKTLQKIKALAKREKKQIAFIGKEISFLGTRWNHVQNRPEIKAVRGSGMEIQLQ